jgi:hypothetical protein
MLFPHYTFLHDSFGKLFATPYFALLNKREEERRSTCVCLHYKNVNHKVPQEVRKNERFYLQHDNIYFTKSTPESDIFLVYSNRNEYKAKKCQKRICDAAFTNLLTLLFTSYQQQKRREKLHFAMV